MRTHPPHHIWCEIFRCLKKNGLPVVYPFAFTLISQLTRVCLSPQILDVRNVMVVVSRWYGGILLGPDRFKHINNCARNILVEEGYTASTVRRSPARLQITLPSSIDTSSVKRDIAVGFLMQGNTWCLVVLNHFHPHVPLNP